jgi:hypothetical protein
MLSRSELTLSSDAESAKAIGWRPIAATTTANQGNLVSGKVKEYRKTVFFSYLKHRKRLGNCAGTRKNGR